MSAMPIIPSQSKPATRMLTADPTISNTKPNRRKPNETVDRLTRMEHARPPAVRSSSGTKNPIHGAPTAGFEVRLAFVLARPLGAGAGAAVAKPGDPGAKRSGQGSVRTVLQLVGDKPANAYRNRA